MKKRILSVILAALLVLTLLPVSALAEEDPTDEIFKAEDEVLRVYELTPGSGIDRELRHTFTYGELCTLAEEGQLGYMYREDGWSVCAVTEYAPLDRVLAAAGLALNADDVLRLRGADGGETAITAREREEAARFYPDGSSPDVYTDVPAVIALAWSSGSAGDYGTPDDALTNLAAAAVRDDLRFACGISAEEFANASAPGERLTQSLREITVVRPCAEHTWEQTPGEAWRASGTETCTEGAEYFVHCSVCGAVGSDTFPTPALGHDFAIHIGNDDETHTLQCSRCDAAETVPHVYQDGVCSCGTPEPEKKLVRIAVSAPAEITVGETAEVSLTIRHDDGTVTTCSAYRFTLTYDAEKLTYKWVSDPAAAVTDKDGTLTIVGSDAMSLADPFTVAFEGQAEGAASVALIGAGIDVGTTPPDAPAVIEPAAAEITVKAASEEEPKDTAGESAETNGAAEETVEVPAEFTVETKEFLKANDKSVVLILAAGTPAGGRTFAYDGSAMFYSEKYGAYAYLVFAEAPEAVLAGVEAKITEIGGETAKIDYTGDVNQTGAVDVNDAQFVRNMYNAKYTDFTTGAAVEKFLRADVNGDGIIDVKDAAAIVEKIA